VGTEGEQKHGMQDIPWHWSWLGGLSVVYVETFERRNVFNISFSVSHYFVEKNIFLS